MYYWLILEQPLYYDVFQCCPHIFGVLADYSEIALYMALFSLCASSHHMIVVGHVLDVVWQDVMLR